MDVFLSEQTPFAPMPVQRNGRHSPGHRPKRHNVKAKRKMQRESRRRNRAA